MNDLRKTGSDFSATILAMIVSLRHFLGWLVSAFHSREDLVLENLALRRQLLALHAQQPRRRLTALHKLFWVALRTFWSGWLGCDKTSRGLLEAPKVAIGAVKLQLVTSGRWTVTAVSGIASQRKEHEVTARNAL